MPHTLPQLDTRRGGFSLFEREDVGGCCTMVNDGEQTMDGDHRCPNQGESELCFMVGVLQASSVCMHAEQDAWRKQGALVTSRTCGVVQMTFLSAPGARSGQLLDAAGGRI